MSETSPVRVRQLLHSLRGEFQNSSLVAFVDELLALDWEGWEGIGPGGQFVRLRAQGFPFDMIQGGFLLGGADVLILRRRMKSVLDDVSDMQYEVADWAGRCRRAEDKEVVRASVACAWQSSRSRALTVAASTSCPVADVHILAHRAVMRWGGAEAYARFPPRLMERLVSVGLAHAAQGIAQWLQRVPQRYRSDEETDWCPLLSQNPEMWVPPALVGPASQVDRPPPGQDAGAFYESPARREGSSAAPHPEQQPLPAAVRQASDLPAPPPAAESAPAGGGFRRRRTGRRGCSGPPRAGLC